MVWPVQFLGDDRPDMPVELEDEMFDKVAVWDQAFQAGAAYLSNYLHEFYATTTGKDAKRWEAFYNRADWIDDLFKTPPPPPEEN